MAAIAESRRVIEFIETFLTFGHAFSGQRFELEEFQKDILRDIYDVRLDDGRRARQKYLLGLPRKNGKSQLGAAIALYHLIADRSNGTPEVISAAGDRKQAKLVFGEAKRMVEANRYLRAHCEVYRDHIEVPSTGGTYTAVSADAGLQQGLNPSAVVFDELHVFKKSDLLDALTQGSAMRPNPLFLIISTAGFDLDSPLGEHYERAMRLDGRLINGVRQTGEDVDLGFGCTWWGPVLAELADDGFDPRDPATWRRFNPLWDRMPNPMDYYTNQARDIHEAEFIRFHLNGWTSSRNSFLPLGRWAARGADVLEIQVRIPDGNKVVLGFDGAWKGDSTGLIAVDLETLHIEVLGHWEAPMDNPDWQTPIPEVKAAVLDAVDRFDVIEMAADPYRFEQTLQEIQVDHGVPVVEFPTNVRARMVPATGAFYKAVLNDEITHDGNPALARHLNNAVLKETDAGSYITKESRASRRHIDLAVAAIVGHQRARHWRDDTPQPRDDSLLVVL